MARWAALLVLVITGCSQPASPVARASVSPLAKPTSAPSASSTASVSQTAPATAIPDLPVSTLGFSCRLPFSWDDAKNVDQFITFPGGVVTIDPNGNGGWYFDRAFSRWLPVSRWAVSPDGSQYADIESLGTAGGNEYVIHVVAVATGKETLVHIPNQTFNGQPYVFDFSADGIYLVQAFERLLPGLWLVDPVAGSIQQISKDLYPVYSAGNGIVWVQVLNPDDPKPVATQSSAGILPNEIDRVDLRSGTRTVWLYQAGEGLSVVGLDSRGLPLIESGLWGVDPNAQLLLVTAPDSPQSIYKGAIAEWLGGSFTDSHGVWFGGQRGIYLYTNGALLKVADHPSALANGCF